MNKEIIELRHLLHKYPEVSNDEFKTSETIQKFIEQKSCPDEIIKFNKTALAFIYKGELSGKTLMFRAELDALPIREKTGLEYTSQNENVSHVCGHDGHMSILAGLSQKISKNRPTRGKVILLFQPAEEVEQGARDVVNSKIFKQFEPDYIFALHNIPGIEKHKIIVKKGSFAAASKGMIVKLKGKTSHAAEPENGISPANAISDIIKELHSLINNKKYFSDLTLLTIIHIRMGEISFGTTPGYAEIMLTLRAFENKDMDILTEKCETIFKKICINESLKYEISYNEVFPATINDDYCTDLVITSVKENNFQLGIMEIPFKWSEDFAYFTEKYQGCLFGLGSGVEQPQLHNPDFDFPDDIIKTGVDVFYNIYKKINF